MPQNGYASSYELFEHHGIINTKGISLSAANLKLIVQLVRKLLHRSLMEG